MTAHALLFTLAAIGVSETVYLINQRYSGEKPTCPINESDCHIVLESKYNKTFGIHNDVLGLLFYIVLAVITTFLVLEVQPKMTLDLIIKVLIYTGAAMSIYFTLLQGWIIKLWCFWCLMSAATVFLMTIIVLTSSLMP